MEVISKFVAAAENQIGTAWKHQGRVPGVALDCLGLLVYAAGQAGVIDDGHDSFNYRRSGDMLELVEAITRYCTEVAADDIRRGDILLFTGKQMYNHLGIALGGGLFVHAYAVNRMVCRARLSTEWEPTAVYRFKGAV